MSFLLVPIQLDALWLPQSSSAIGPDVHFEKLPWYNRKSGLYMNQDKAYLAESIVSCPFQNDTLHLEKGVHLHWALPSMLTTGKSENDGTVFPAVPNRWYICKSKNGVREEWIVESDYIWDAEDYTCPIHALCVVPQEVGLNEGSQPYAYMGRKYTLKEWLQSPGNPQNYWHNQKDRQALTAMGWGSLVFDTFYPHSRSVFGMHDSDAKPSKNATDEHQYTVIGWYDRENGICNQDVIKEIIETVNADENIEKTYAQKFSEQLQASILRSDFSELTSSDRLSEIRHTLYYGWIDMRTQTDPQPQVNNIQLSVANTPAEAISALLIQNANNALSAGERLKEEEKLEAVMSFDDLNALQLDVATRLREIRHQKGFISTEGLYKWRIELDDTAEKKRNENGDEETAVEKIPLEIVNLLKQLRKIQSDYDVKRHAYTSALDALYMDWSRYMFSMYPPEGQTQEYPDADLVRFYIQEHSLKRAEQLKKELGNYPDANGFDTSGSDIGLGEQIGALISSIESALEKLNTSLHQQHPQKTYVLKRLASTQYWEALPPALVLSAPASDRGAGDLLKFSDRLKQDPSDAFLYLDDVSLLSESNLSKGAGFGLHQLIAHLRKNKLGNTWFGQSKSRVNEWHTFRVEWEVELFPVASGNEATRGSSTFSKTFITQNYMLPEEEADLNIHPSLSGLSLMSNGALYTGASYVTDTVKQGFLGKLKAYQSMLGEAGTKRQSLLKYIQELEQTQLLSLSLTGFNDIMLQQSGLMRLAPGDPFGFESHRNFAARIAAILSGGEGNSPSPSVMFNPVRNGAVKITAIRLIDVFGRTSTIDPQEVVTSSPNRIPQKSNWVNLPPRLSQAATMSMRWVDSVTEIQDELKNKTSLESPVSGWLLPVYINQRIEFFDVSGKHLGAITHKGTWENSVFDHAIAQAKTLDFIANPHLRQVIEWLIAKAKEKSFHEAFISVFQDTANSIHPESGVNPSLIEIMATTPIAITQVVLNLFLKGKPAFDLDWNVLRTELQHKLQRNSKDFTKIRFPYILGDFHQYNDGVIAYWQQDEALGEKIYFNNAVRAMLTGSVDRPLPPGLEEEAQFRYDLSKTLPQLLLELNREEILRKHEFTKHYIKNGSKYWDILVKAGWIRLVQSEHKAIGRSLDNENLTCSIDDESHHFTVLMHPKGTIHLSTGILPVKKLKFPENSYKKALRTIELSFLSSPVITPMNELNLSLHQDSRFEWSWLQAQKTGNTASSEEDPPKFVRTLQRRHIRFDLFQTVWNHVYENELLVRSVPGAAEAWAQMHAFGFVDPALTFEKEKTGFLKQDTIQEAQQAYDALPDKNNLPDDASLQLAAKAALIGYLLPVFAQAVQGIGPFETKASAVPSLGIREGWLSVKSNVTKHGDT